MADAAEDLDLEPVQPQLEEQEPEAPPETQDGQQPEGDEDEFQVSFEGDGAAPAPSEEKDSDLVRHLRNEVRERDRRLKALEAQSQPQKVELGEKPTLAGCEYDEEAYDRALDDWRERKAQAEKQEQDANRTREAQNKAWTDELAALETQETALKTKAKDYPQAKADVEAVLSPVQLAALTWAANDKAVVLYALGKHPQKLAELAKIEHPVKFAAEVARLEGKLTMTTRKAPPPEQIARGSASLSAGADKHLERLEKEAERSGDRSKVIAYKRQLRAQGKS